jgi:NADPH:quinone reductase
MAYFIAARKPGGVDVLYKHEFDVKAPKKGMVMLRQTAIGVNFIDIYFRNGLYPWPVDNDLILGCEAAGVVEAIGPDVEGFSIGDRVVYTVANNAYTTHRNIDAKHLIHIPEGIDDDIASASILKGLTVYYLLYNSFKVKAGQTVLFHAASGGIGLIAGQWLKALGVIAIGTAGGKVKCALAKEYGFSHVIDYNSEDFVKRVDEITQGEGVDAVYDSVGKDTYPGSLNCLKQFGTLINFGQSSGSATDFKIADLAVGSYTLTRPILYHFTQNSKWLAKASQTLFDMIEKQGLTVPINQSFPLDQVAEAHRLLEGRKTTGCTILTP